MAFRHLCGAFRSGVFLMRSPVSLTQVSHTQKIVYPTAHFTETLPKPRVPFSVMTMDSVKIPMVDVSRPKVLCAGGMIKIPQVIEMHTDIAVTTEKSLLTTFADTETVTVIIVAKKTAVGDNEEFLRTKYYQEFSKGNYGHAYFEGALDLEK